jgi:hypothetical protein
VTRRLGDWVIGRLGDWEMRWRNRSNEGERLWLLKMKKIYIENLR